jgi:hypothetical protein
MPIIWASMLCLVSMCFSATQYCHFCDCTRVEANCSANESELWFSTVTYLEDRAEKKWVSAVECMGFKLNWRCSRLTLALAFKQIEHVHKGICFCNN